MGKPFGQALGHSQGDPPSFAYPFMWAHGAMEVEEDGTTVAINKPEFVEALQAFTQHWKDAYDETGLSWDDGANNRAFLSDQLSGTLNGSSIYIAAVKRRRRASRRSTTRCRSNPTTSGTRAIPAGPAGRFNALGSRSIAAMNYSPNAEAAVEFLQHFFTPEVFIPWLESQGGYIIPMAPGYADLEIYTGNPTLAPYPGVSEYSRNKGYAGPSNQKAAEAVRALRHRRYDRAGDPVGRCGGRRAAGRGAAAAHLRRLAASRHGCLAARDRGSQARLARPPLRTRAKRLCHGAAHERHHRRNPEPEVEVVRQPRGKARFWEREAPLAYIFMIPGLVILLLFMAYPFFLGIYLSMTDKMVGFADFNFVWFENFQLLLRRPDLSPHRRQHPHLQLHHRAVQAVSGAWSGVGAESDVSLQPIHPGRVCCCPSSSRPPSAAWPG